jgi:hypothetical protein
MLDGPVLDLSQHPENKKILFEYEKQFDKILNMVKRHQPDVPHLAVLLIYSD